MSATSATSRRRPADPPEHRRAVGAMVRAARLDRGLSLGAVGDRVGTSPVMIHHVESGRSRMPRARIAAAAEVLGLAPEAFERPSLAAQDAKEAAMLVGFRHLPESEQLALLQLVSIGGRP
ncbi:helix-turn-helix transcriptional regulator [Methylobacterium sp. SI9]|uniref:helix-turn-helix domain-containing protein n=1 Tax=Methylobacterium guangdongense TaxID=3138811 RepID=UPI00313B7ACD